MNCLYHAYVDHLSYLGLEPEQPLSYFEGLRDYVHGHPSLVYGGVAYWLVLVMAGWQRLSVGVQWRLWSPSHYQINAENGALRAFSSLLPVEAEADPLTLAPAIYLVLFENHARFALEVPAEGQPVMALQLRKGENDG